MLSIKVLVLLALISNSFAVPLKRNNLVVPPPKLKADDVNYRLPKEIVPNNYKLDLTLAADAFDTNTFNGTVTITFTATYPEGATNNKEVKLHAKRIDIKAVLLTTGNGSLIETEKPTLDNITDFVTIPTKAVLTSGEYILAITYEGQLSETSMTGFYKSTYQEDGKTKYLATTQFEPPHAREAFPSFDEPGFKATFDISITYPVEYFAMSNANHKFVPERVDDDLKKSTFVTTPSMSTYLVAFIVSDFHCLTGIVIDLSIPTAVCARTSANDTVELAKDVALDVLIEMELFTGYLYGDSHLREFKQVAIPDFSAGAMENWGLVTYREADLLWDPKESSDVYRQAVITVIAHELSHQWFGDLVTLDWWQDVFLNEGFASYFEYHIPNIIYPELDTAQQFVVEELQNALQADSSGSSLALSSDVNTPSQISNHFDSISYDKGGSILRMVHHLLGLDNFQRGLTDYITDRKFNNSNSTQLWTALSEYAPNDVPDTLNNVMYNWTNQPGYPLLTVDVDGDNIIIKQKRFLVTPNDGDDTKWFVPITYSTSNQLSFNDTTTKVWLKPTEDLKITDALKDADWIILNHQQHGFYRVNYNNDLWNKISDYLSGKNSNKVHVLNKAQIVDDLFALTRAGIKTYSELFSLLSFLKNEDNYYPWYPAFNGFQYLLDRSADGALYKSLVAYISDLSKKLYDSTSFEPKRNHMDTRKQILALTWACKLGNKDCLSKSKDLFKTYKSNTKTVDRNVKSVVYCNGLRQSDNVTSDYDFLWQKYTGSQLATEKITILTALGCVSDKDVLTTYVKEAIGNYVRRQDASTVFSSVYSNSKQGVDVVLDFVKSNYKNFTVHFGSVTTLNSLVATIAGRVTRQDQIDSLTAFSKIEDLDPTTATVAQGAVNVAATSLQEYEELQKQLNEYFKPNGSVLIKANSLLMIVVGFTVLIYNRLYL